MSQKVLQARLMAQAEVKTTVNARLFSLGQIMSPNGNGVGQSAVKADPRSFILLLQPLMGLLYKPKSPLAGWVALCCNWKPHRWHSQGAPPLYPKDN